MRNHIITSTIILSAVAALSSCSIIAREATEELAYEIEDEIELRTRDGGRTDDFTILTESIADVFDDEKDEDAEWRPRTEGLEDADADGFDDDGRVGIVVRNAESCIIVDGAHVDVTDDDC